MSFSKKCFCKKTEEKFSSNRELGETVVTQFFCPDCAGRAPGEAVLFEIEDVPGKLGVYGIDWNEAELRRFDSDFSNDLGYYEDLILSGGLTLECLAKEEKTPVFWGWKREDDLTEALGGRDYLLAEDEVPTKLPKKTRSGPDESYNPRSGYKGHR